MSRYAHYERHVVARMGWLRAAVLGANDGLVSTASLIIGVAAAGADRDAILLAGMAGLVAGAMSMAAGEFVSVSSQADAESSELEKEARELIEQPKAEQAELAGIYRARGLSPETAEQVARELTAHDALGAHARDELGLTEEHAARPLQAALASALMFAAGAALPLLVVLVATPSALLVSVVVSSIAGLALLGAASARAGQAPVGRAVWRVTLWGALAMAVTALIGRLAGAVV
jgi:VIT1/CCC1 family predicted Fe2+/Mn2+ transporter